jgi:hypothetical protein
VANIHVLERRGARHRLVLHVAVPNLANAAGLNYRTALARSGLGTPASVLLSGDGTGGTIEAAEASALASGALLELVVELDVTQGGSLTNAAAIAAYLDDFHAAAAVAAVAQLQAALSQFGRTR